MTSEFEKRIGLLNFERDTVAKMMKLITEAGKVYIQNWDR